MQNRSLPNARVLDWLDETFDANGCLPFGGWGPARLVGAFLRVR
ncbi:hypothetical protein ACSSVZ_003035 [Amorphus sp. MBR-141]